MIDATGAGSAGGAFRRGNGCLRTKNPTRSLNCLDASVAVSSRHLHVIVSLRGFLAGVAAIVLTLAYYRLKFMASRFQNPAGLGMVASPASLYQPPEPLPAEID